MEKTNVTPIFYLVRHGRTANNTANKYRGWSNSPEAQLSIEGKEDARLAGEWFKAHGMTFDIAIVDDLDRTQETAKIVCDIIGCKHIITDKRLRPLNVGDFTGESKDENPLDEYIKNRDKKIPGGESLNDFDKRQASVFGDIFDTVTKRSRMVLVFGHGSNASFLANAGKLVRKEKKVGYEGLTDPGGIMEFTDRGLIPLVNIKKKAEKLDQWVVAYYPADDGVPPSGTSCGQCWKFVKSGACVEVKGNIEADKTCINFVEGTPFKSDPRLPIMQLDKHVVGYGPGNTKCDKCEYFHGLDKCEKVKGYDGLKNLEHIEAGGCCNAFEEKK